jgi:GNAT superfamily N-acetyltransferase
LRHEGRGTLAGRQRPARTGREQRQNGEPYDSPHGFNIRRDEGRAFGGNGLAIEIQRAASERDFSRLHGLFVAYEDDLIPELRHGDVPPVEDLRRIYSGVNAAFLANRERRAVGCVAVMRFDSQTAVIRHLFVAPSARGAGAARALVTGAIAFAGEGGCARVVLDTAKEHLPVAYRLYLSLGFRESAPYTTVTYRCPTFMELRLD